MRHEQFASGKFPLSVLSLAILMEYGNARVRETSTSHQVRAVSWWNNSKILGSCCSPSFNRSTGKAFRSHCFRLSSPSALCSVAIVFLLTRVTTANAQYLLKSYDPKRVYMLRFHIVQQIGIQPCMIATHACSQLNRENEFSLPPLHSRPRIWCRETG